MNRDELREAIVGVIEKHIKPTPTRPWPASRIADALLAGPVGELLAENERLRVDLDRVAGCECHKGPWGGPDRKGGYDDGWRAAMRFAHHAHAAPDGHHPSANGVLGAGPDAVIVDEDWLHDLTAECDRLRATLDAVRKYADERAVNGRRNRTVHSIRIASDLRRILDAADGGADCCHTKHGGPVNPDACHRCYVETRHVRDGGDSDE